MFLPDDRPPRLSEEAKTAIRKLASYLRQDRINLQDADADYDAAVTEAGKEIEPRLLYGLLLLKESQRNAEQRDVVLKEFDEIKVQRPDLLLPLEATIWVRFDKRAYPTGIDELAELVAKIPKPKNPGDAYPENMQQLFTWAGQLRDFAAVAAEEGRRPSASTLAALDAAIAKHGPDAERLYEEGRAKSPPSTPTSSNAPPRPTARPPRPSSRSSAADLSTTSISPSSKTRSRSSTAWASDRTPL